MDALVVWQDGTKNVRKNDSLLCDLGEEVTTEYQSFSTENSSDEDLPLSVYKQRNFVRKNNRELIGASEEVAENRKSKLSDVNEDMLVLPPSPLYDSDADPPFGQCGVRTCKDEVFSSCEVCEKLICWTHFVSDMKHCCRKRNWKHLAARNESVNDDELLDDVIITSTVKKPEHYMVEGGEKENVEAVKQKRLNQYHEAKRLRSLGVEYRNPVTQTTVQAKRLKNRSNGETCKKIGKLCSEISDEQRKLIFSQYYALSHITKKREFLLRHIEKSTFDISNRTRRTALSKLSESGIVEKDKRGGRHRSQAKIKEELQIKEKISKHIDRFPKVESHFCRSSSSRMYLHPDLSLPKMYSMFLQEL